MWDWFHAQGGTNNLSLLKPGGAKSIPGYDVVYPTGLKSPSVDEYAVGYGIQVTPAAYAKVDLIYRNWNDFYSFRVTEGNETVTDFLGIGHDLQIVENSNNIEREYRGVQFQSSWRPSFHDDRIQLGLNYTWSTLKGNDTQESANSGVVGNDDPKNFYPEFLAYEQWKPVGYLAGDQRHRLRAWVGYNLPVPEVVGRINAYVLHNFDSGLPYSAAGTIDTWQYEGAPEFSPNLTYSGFGTATYFFSDRGEFRTDDIQSTDVSLNYSRGIWRGVEIFAQGEMFNAFNNDGVDNVDTTIRTWTSGGTFCGGARCKQFNPFTDTPVEGVHFAKGDNFGKPTAITHYQASREYRFSLGLRF